MFSFMKLSTELVKMVKKKKKIHKGGNVSGYFFLICMQDLPVGVYVCVWSVAQSCLTLFPPHGL